MIHRWTLLAVLPLLAIVASAHADPPRSVAIVEFRAGSTAAPEIGARIARTLTIKTGLAIMAPAAARQEYGARLDAEVKRCGDDAKCIAKIGVRLNVDEILLIGVSELGAVIVTIQRVLTAEGVAAGKMAETLESSDPPSDAELERFLRLVLPDKDFEQWGKIEIDSNVEAATVLVDGQRRGITPLPPVTVAAPKSYDVAVAKSGYSEFRARIAVTPNALVVVKPELTLLPADAWYKKWWVLALAGAVTAGAVTTAIVIATDGAADVPVMVEPF